LYSKRSRSSSRRHQEGDGEECAGAPPEAAPLHRAADRRERGAQPGQLPGELAGEKAQELDAVERARRLGAVGRGVARAAHEVPDFGQRAERTVEADRQRRERAPHQPGVGQDAEQRQAGEQPGAPGDLLAQRPKQYGERRRDQQHERPVIAQAQAEQQRDPGQRRSRPKREPGQEQEEEGIEGIDLGDDRLRPEHRRKAQYECGEPCRQPGEPELARAEPRRRARERAEQRGSEMDAIGDRAHR
jgi:hypothetical protein